MTSEPYTVIRDPELDNSELIGGGSAPRSLSSWVDVVAVLIVAEGVRTPSATPAPAGCSKSTSPQSRARQPEATPAGIFAQPPRIEDWYGDLQRKELEYLHGQPLARLATVNAKGAPHVVPVGFRVSEAGDAIDVGGHGFAGSKKHRDIEANQKVAIVIDDLASSIPLDPPRDRGPRHCRDPRVGRRR
jgi:PPOX class F420-dependent enzyme/OxyR family protein